MKDRSNLFLMVFMILVLAVSYLWYTRFREAPLDSGAASEERVLIRELVYNTNRIRSLKIDTSFLESSIFNSLEDLTIDINIPSEIGRENPFLPFE